MPVRWGIQLQELRNDISKGLAEAGRGKGAGGDVFMHGLIDDLDAGEAKHTAG